MNEFRRKTLGSIIGIIVFIVCLFSITYAFYKWKSNNTNIDIGVHAGGLKFVYSKNNILSSTTLSPVTDYTSSSYYENNNSSLLYTDYTVTNTKSTSYKMITKLNIISISDSLKNSTFKWVLSKKENSVYNKVAEGNFSNLKVGENILNNGIYITPDTKYLEYRFVIYIDGNQENSSTMMNSSIVSNLVLCDEEVKLFNISLDNQEADNNNGGTATIYEKYGVGIYKDSNATNNLMTATSNNISVPLKVGYTFGGYYSKVNGTGDNLINNSGFITDKFTNTYFREDSKIYAKWNINNYTMNVNASNGISNFNVSASDGTSSNNVNSYSQSKPYRTEFTVNNVTSKTGYTYSGYTLNDKLSELSDSSKNTIKVKLGAGTGVLTLNSSTNIYNINYNLNSGIAGSSAPKSGTYDKVINISNPSRNGYTFTGWTASSINTSTALYGKTSSTVTNNWSSGTTKVTDSYFKNLNPTNNSTVTLNATWHDSTKPVCTINTPNDVIYQSTVNVKVTCTDNDSLKSNTLSADNFTISNGTIASVQNVSNVSAVNSKQHEYILTIKGLNVGNYTISLKENSVYDTSGNGNAVVISGTGKVVAKSITDSMVSINPTTFVYDGNNKQPTVSVVDGSTTLILNTNYTLSYSNNINVGTGKVTITGTGNYTGTVTKTFTITAKSIVVPTCSTKTYTGVSQTLLSNGTGYTVSGTTTGIDAGTYSVTVTPTGNYKWSDGTTTSKSVSCKIDKKSIAVTWEETVSFTYNGSAQAPTVTTPVTGVNGESINITRTTQTNVGSYTSTASCSSVNGGRAKCSNYNLTNNTKAYTITRKSVSVPSCSTKTYTGVSQTLLSNGTGYTVSGTTTGIDAGTYSVTVTPTGNYQWSDNTTSSKSVSCKIDKKSISVTWGETTSFTYNGSAQAPTVTTPVTGVNGESVNITRTTQTNVGSYTSTASCSSVSGGRAKCSNYNLTNNTKSFTINKKSIGVPSCSTKTYTGVSQTLLSNGTGYTVSGTTTGIDAGTYSVTVTPIGNYQWSDNTTSSKSVSCKIDKKSISVTWGGTTSFTYNGSAQAPTVTTPVTGVNGESVNITRTTQTNVGSYTSTASCSSVSGGQAKCSNYSLNNATKAYTISYNTFNITLDTNKPSPLNAGYYTDGTNTIYMRYHDGVYLDSNYSNKMSSSSNKITVPTATGYDFLGYYDGDIIMINSTGEISSNFTNTTYSGAKTLTAKWKRNFACNDSTTIGSNISYSGKNWTVVTKNEWSCQLVLNEQSSATGSYNDASSKLTNEYLSSGGISGNKTLYNEMQAGLLFTVNGSYYADTNGGKTNINGLYWYGSGNVWDSTARTIYEISNVYPIYSGSYQSTSGIFTSYDGNRTKEAKTVATSTIPAGTRGVTNTSANYTLNKGKSTPSVVTGSANNRFSRAYNIFSAEPKSTKSFVLHKEDGGSGSGSYSNTNWRVRFYPCGGDSSYSNKLAWRYTAKSKTAVTFENVITSTSYSDGANRRLIMASTSTSTTENKTNGVLRTYQNYSSSHCTTFNTYTISNVNYPIHYRLHIDVKRYS